MTKTRFASIGAYKMEDLIENRVIDNMEDIEELLNNLNDENERLKDDVYDEMDNALAVLRDLYEVMPLKSQKKMNDLYNRLKSLRDEMKWLKIYMRTVRIITVKKTCA